MNDIEKYNEDIQEIKAEIKAIKEMLKDFITIATRTTPNELTKMINKVLDDPILDAEEKREQIQFLTETAKGNKPNTSYY